MKFTAAKAVWGAVVGFVAPGAAYLIGVSGDGFTTNELVVGALTCFVSAAAVGTTVYAVQNKPVEEAPRLDV